MVQKNQRYKELKPIEFNPKIEEKVRKKIAQYFEQVIFSPIFEQLKTSKKKFFNSSSVLADAILGGKIQYADGILKGDFNASISREMKQLGYKFDSRIKGYRIRVADFPTEVQSAIGQARLNFGALQSEIINIFDNLNYTESLKKLTFMPEYFGVQKSIDKQFMDTVADAIGVVPDFTDTQKQKIAEEFSDNLKLYVKDFIDKETLKLRKLVEDNTFSGMRADRLQEIIKNRFDVSDRKAKFLAKQETGLLTAKYREARYKDAGINQYIWSTSGDERVREDHKELNGKVFSFDNPPVVDKATGRRANPSEDFGCRCKAKPLVLTE